MKIGVIISSPPLAEGGHLVLARSLVEALRDAGHEAGLVVTPQNRFGRLPSSYLAAWLTDVEVAYDGAPIHQVISLRFPAYAVRHPRHVVWLNHRMREYYDLWERFRATLSWRARLKERVRRRLLHAVDRRLLTHRVARLYTISGTIRERLRRFGGIPAEVLYPPAPQRPYRCDGYGDELFAVSRMTPLKRMDLLLRALAEPAAQGVRCAIAGEGPDAGRIHRLVSDLGLDGRVTLLGRIDTGTLVARLASCRAVVFPTYDEDYGLVTVEAFASRKAVVTCTDSGGPAELVQDGVSGFVCAPTPAALAVPLARLAGERGLAERLGEGGFRTGAEITWPRTLERLILP
ncbi:MAG TPA: glycosyltransferase family 4 protein [Vicinamibacterales bacterium]|nr:glycosyltransferase family 4 protein [Vicinamibacterales bacterium]